MINEHGVSANVGKPRVTYKETITIPTILEYEHSKNTTDQSIYGYVKLKVTPKNKRVWTFFRIYFNVSRFPRKIHCCL